MLFQLIITQSCICTHTYTRAQAQMCVYAYTHTYPHIHIFQLSLFKIADSSPQLDPTADSVKTYKINSAILGVCAANTISSEAAFSTLVPSRCVGLQLSSFTPGICHVIQGWGELSSQHVWRADVVEKTLLKTIPNPWGVVYISLSPPFPSVAR